MTDFIWAFGKLPFPLHLGFFFKQFGKKIHKIEEIKTIFGLGMTPLQGGKNVQINKITVGEIDWLQHTSVQSCKLTEHLSTCKWLRRHEPNQDKWFVRQRPHMSLSCLLGRCLISGLEVSFISMSGKSSIKLEVLPVAVAWSVAMPIGTQVVQRSIPASGTFFSENLVMKIFFWPFFR